MPPARTARASSGELRATLAMFALFALAAILARSFVAAPFTIPSESMLPRLLIGDYLLVAKWPYGWSRHSLPLGLPLFAGRIGGEAPARGDVVVFKSPAAPRVDFVKRVIGLPGDRLQLRGGALFLNGRAVPRLRIADFLDPITPNSPCRPRPGLAIRAERDPATGDAVCRYRRYRETLPGGRSYAVIDLGAVPQADDTPVFTVPPGRYFLLGDNRDRSADSRFPAARDAGVGFVPADHLVGRALVTFWSTDGSARWTNPTTWHTAARWERIGEGF